MPKKLKDIVYAIMYDNGVPSIIKGKIIVLNTHVFKKYKPHPHDENLDGDEESKEEGQAVVVSVDENGKIIWRHEEGYFRANVDTNLLFDSPNDAKAYLQTLVDNV